MGQSRGQPALAMPQEARGVPRGRTALPTGLSAGHRTTRRCCKFSGWVSLRWHLSLRWKRQLSHGEPRLCLCGDFWATHRWIDSVLWGKTGASFKPEEWKRGGVISQGEISCHCWRTVVTGLWPQGRRWGQLHSLPPPPRCGLLEGSVSMHTVGWAERAMNCCCRISGHRRNRSLSEQTSPS